MSKRELYLHVNKYESTGDLDNPGDGTRWSGFSHTVINVNEWGPIYFAEEGRGWSHTRIDECDYLYDFDLPRPVESNIPKDTKFLYLVVIRYGDGGTFGRIDGQYKVPGVFLSSDDAYSFALEHEKDFKAAHNGYFESYEGWSVEIVELKDENDVKPQRW